MPSPRPSSHCWGWLITQLICGDVSDVIITYTPEQVRDKRAATRQANTRLVVRTCVRTYRWLSTYPVPLHTEFWSINLYYCLGDKGISLGKYGHHNNVVEILRAIYLHFYLILWSAWYRLSYNYYEDNGSKSFKRNTLPTLAPEVQK